MKVPSGYTWLRRDEVRALIREDLVGALACWLLAPEFVLPAAATPLRGGRGGSHRLPLPDGTGAVARQYRRGGAVARWVGETYLGPWRPRPFRELQVATEARARGVPTAEVLAARVCGRVLYDGVLVTAELAGALPVLSAVHAASDVDARRRLAAAAGRAVGAMHGAGVHHVDLNLGNVLAQVDATGTRASVIDFDRARLTRRPVPASARRRSLQRLRRSLHKLERDAGAVEDELMRCFGQAYEEGAGVPCAC
jgi:3-deoxy-D-manno-octulosonic acid kinase